MVIIKNLRFEKGLNDSNSFYVWDVVSDEKLATFYTDENGQNIWQEGVASNKTHIYNGTVIDQLAKSYCIDVSENIENIKKQLQDFADSGFFNEFLK